MSLQGVFNGRQTCDIISQLALALEYAGKKHNDGIIHRDIKPVNIVLDYQGNVKLMDFGIVEKTINKEDADIKTLVPDVPDGLAEFIRRALVKDHTQRISSWSEIQTLLATGKSSKLELLTNSDMDMAVVIKFKTHAIDTELLLKEIHQVLKVDHASYELKAIERELGPGLYPVIKRYVMCHVQQHF